MIQVEGHKNLYRDEESGAIVNIDTIGHSQYIKMRGERKKQKEEIEQIKEDINEIKLLLKEIINGKNGSK
jgi:hypothetical protein